MKMTEISRGGEIVFVEAGATDVVLFCECTQCMRSIDENTDDNNLGLCDSCLQEIDEEPYEVLNNE